MFHVFNTSFYPSTWLSYLGLCCLGTFGKSSFYLLLFKFPYLISVATVCIFFYIFEKQKLRHFASPNYFPFDIKLHAWILMLHFLPWELKLCLLSWALAGLVQFSQQGSLKCLLPHFEGSCSHLFLNAPRENASKYGSGEGCCDSCNVFSIRMKWKKKPRLYQRAPSS